MQLITAKEVCIMCRISMTTLIRWRKIGIIPSPLNVGKCKKLLWLLSDIEEWMKKKQND